MASRLARLRHELKAQGVEAALIWNRANVRYLSGFTGTEGTLLVTDQHAIFFTDSRYTEQAVQQVTPHGFTVELFKQKFKEIPARVTALDIGTLGFEDEATTVSQSRLLSQELPSVRFREIGRLATALREVKDAAEIVAIRQAVEVQEQAFEAVLPLFKPGATEWDLALQLDFEMRRRGALTVSFDTIVASGPRGAMPHGTASDKPLAKGEMIVVDWGCIVDGYCSDQTMTVCLGKPSDPDAKKVFEIVQRAQRTCIDGIRPGMNVRDIDKLAREVIIDAGYGDYFGHGTGHSLGLEIHEEPRVSPLGNGSAVPGLVFTVEPGIYLPGRFGVRLEDIVVVTETGAEVLTTVKKNWTSL